jgi:4-amino-4-deoxy-L-arabinose transferase-like glycosyltransferase
MAKIIELIKKKTVASLAAYRQSWLSFYKERSSWGKFLIWAFGAFLIADLFTVLWGMPNFASWSPDDQSGPFIIGFAKFPAYKYAAFGYIINFILYLPILALYFLTGNWDISNAKYPDFGFPDPHWQIGALIVVSRLLSFALYLGAGLFLYKATKRLGRRVAFLAAMLYMLSPLVVEFSTYGNLDAPIMFFSAVCFWAMANIYFSVEGEGRLRERNWVFFFLSLAAISATKEPNTFTFVIPFFFLLFYKGYVSRAGLKRFVSEMLPGIFYFFICFLVFTGILWDWSAYVAHVKRWIGPTSTSWNDYQRLGILGVSWRTLESLALGAPIALIASLVGFFIHRRGRAFLVFLLMFPLSFFLLALASVGLVYLRYVMVMVIFLSIPAALALNYAYERMGRDKRLYAAVFFPLIFSLAMVPVWGKFNDSRYEAERFIMSAVRGKTVQVLSNRYHTYLPRMEKLADDSAWSAKSVFFSSELSAIPDRDLYIVEYEKLSRYQEKLAQGYGVLYDSGPRYPYWHAIDPGLEPCRISCRVLILERNDGGAIVRPLDFKVKSYYDAEPGN